MITGCPEARWGKTSYELGWKLKGMTNKNKQKITMGPVSPFLTNPISSSTSLSGDIVDVEITLAYHRLARAHPWGHLQGSAVPGTLQDRTAFPGILGVTSRYLFVSLGSERVRTAAGIPEILLGVVEVLCSQSAVNSRLILGRCVNLRRVLSFTSAFA